MANQIEYGDIVQVTSSNGFWTAGQKMYILCPEGDGDLGLREHAVCFKLGEDGRPAKNLGAFEVPWTEIDFSTIQDSAELALNTRLKTIEDTIKKHVDAKQVAEKMCAAIKKGKNEFLDMFAREIDNITELE